MASSGNDTPPLERLLEQARRDLTALFPSLLGFTESAARRQNPEDQSRETADEVVEERVVIINPFTQTMVVLGEGGASALEALLRASAAAKGTPPATKASVEAMPIVEACGDGECAICLEEWGIGGGSVKEMPCKHRFHGECIEKWLGMHGSCPVCRYAMPFDEEEREKKGEESGTGRVLVTFSMRYGSGGEGEGRDSSADQETES